MVLTCSNHLYQAAKDMLHFYDDVDKSSRILALASALSVPWLTPTLKERLDFIVLEGDKRLCLTAGVEEHPVISGSTRCPRNDMLKNQWPWTP